MYELIDTELNTCIDSDDYLKTNAIKEVIKILKENNLTGFMLISKH